MKSLRDYTMVTRPDDNGTFVVYLTAIPGCHAWGQTPEEAQAEIANGFYNIKAHNLSNLACLSPPSPTSGTEPKLRGN